MLLTVIFISSVNCCLKDRTLFCKYFFIMIRDFVVIPVPMFIIKSTENNAM